jgi:hypothetical protein
VWRCIDSYQADGIPSEIQYARQGDGIADLMHKGKQHIVVAVTTNGAFGGGEQIAYALP